MKLSQSQIKTIAVVVLGAAVAVATVLGYNLDEVCKAAPSLCFTRDNMPEYTPPAPDVTQQDAGL